MAAFSPFQFLCPFSSSIFSSFIAAVCPTFSVYPLSPLFQVVAAPHGALTVTLWANVRSCVSFNSYGKNATIAILWDRVPTFSGDEYRLGICFWSVFVSGRFMFAPVFCSYYSAEVIHAGVEIVAWPTWCFYLLNTSPPVSGLASEMSQE